MRNAGHIGAGDSGYGSLIHFLNMRLIKGTRRAAAGAAALPGAPVTDRRCARSRFRPHILVRYFI